jgi:hypothetical protein
MVRALMMGHVLFKKIFEEKTTKCSCGKTTKCT